MKKIERKQQLRRKWIKKEKEKNENTEKGKRNEKSLRIEEMWIKKEKDKRKK